MTKVNRMTTAWSHLPNAAHIDRILADLKVNANNWTWDWAMSAARDRALDAVHSAVRDAVRDAAWDAALDAALDAAYSAAWAAAWDAAFDVARSAILALIVWPESADYLNLSVDSVRVLAALGDHKAVLILPAVIAFESQKAAVVQMIDN